MFAALPKLAFLLIVVGLVAATPRVALATLFLSYDQADNAVDVAPNGAPLSAETQRLFRAVREGDLGAAQQAVLDGADILAVNADGQNAADLAESLNEFTITHFLRAYQAIEDRSGASTTVLETEQPAPIPPAAPESIPESAVTAASPLSGEGIVPSVETVGVEEPPLVEVPSTSPETTSATIAPPSSDLFGETGSSLAGSTGAEVAHTQEPGGEEVSGDYFSRLAKLNPAHQPVSSEAVASPPEPEIAQSPAPEPMAVAEAGDTSVLEEESGVPADGEADGMVEQRPSDGETVPATENERIVFTPSIPPRKPEAGNIDKEPEIFASVQPAEPALEEVDVPMLAEVPEIVESPESGDMKIPVDPAEGSFFAKMRVFSEDPDATAEVADAPPSIPSANAINAEGVPEYEQIRAAVIEKLRRESEDRSQQLADVRELNREEIEREEMVRQHESGTLNIQTELRAKEYATTTGTVFPPGYVPPPDGGSSGVRFLQRLGLFDNAEPSELAQADLPGEERLPSGSVPQHPSVLLEAGEGVMLPELTPGNLAQKSMAFVDYGYSAPPAGRAIDTQDDTAVAALGQIARLFQSPNIGYPAETSALPAPGTLSHPVPMQDINGGITMPQAPLDSGSSAPLNSSDLATPPPMSVTPGAETRTAQTPAVQDIPLSAAELAQIGGAVSPSVPAPPQPPAWEVTATDQQGNEVAPPVPSSSGGLTDRLAHIFDPANPNAVGSGGAVRDANGQPMAITEATGSWDVVAVQAAPTAARTLLGGAVVPKTSVAVAGSRALSMGQTVVLGKGPPVGLDPNARKKACIDKRRGAILFCIERIDWPTELQAAMQVDTVMYQGLNAIVRYDNGVATRFHALFPSDSFDTVVNYYMQRLGSPTDVWERTITPLAAPSKKNPTISWKALNPHSQTTSILEIRQFDDTRGGFPDERRGAVMLYAPQSGAIFPQVSAFELMRLHPGS